MTMNPHWQNGFVYDIKHDTVTGKWWYQLTLEGEAVKEFSFDSEIVYSTREDAEQAAADASVCACMYQAHCFEVKP